MNVEEARAEFILTMEDACIESCDHDSKDGWEHNITIAADAYGAARELRGHVDACHDAAGRVSITGKGLGAKFRECGDGWLCAKAREIEELGK